MSLMGSRGWEGVAINEITEAADVSFGSFYNYFESKEDIYEQLVDEVVDAFGDALSRVTERTDDPAEIVAASARSVLRRVVEDPVWGRFFIRVSASSQVLTQRMGQYFVRDVQRGLSTGRFRTTDPLLAITSVAGTILAAAIVAVELPDATSFPGAEDPPVPLDPQGLPERTAAAILQILGVDASEAAEVARRPIPPLDGSRSTV